MKKINNHRLLFRKIICPRKPERMEIDRRYCPRCSCCYMIEIALLELGEELVVRRLDVMIPEIAKTCAHTIRR